MGCIHDGIELVGRLHIAVPQVVFDEIGRQSVSPILSAGLSQGMECEGSVKLQPRMLGMHAEVS